MEHIAGSSRWAISFRVKKFWVAAMPRTPACLAGGKGSFSARRKAEDIIFCLTYNRISIKGWKRFIFLNYYRTIFIIWRGDNYINFMYCCVHNTWVLFIDIFVHVSSLKHTVKMGLSITLNIIEINNIPFFEKYKAIVLFNTIIQLTWGLRWQATFPRHTVVFVLIPPCNQNILSDF